MVSHLERPNWSQMGQLVSHLERLSSLARCLLDKLINLCEVLKPKYKVIIPTQVGKTLYQLS
jgi:hypothetical protein